MEDIKFFNGKYFFLSNYFPCIFTYDGIQYTNAEAAFQSAKTLDMETRKKFAKLTPNRAKAYGRRILLRDDWEDVKFKIMRDVCRAKFSQNERLKDKLLETKGAYLEEGNTWGDRIWGTCNGTGQNRLGQILMAIRHELEEVEAYEICDELWNQP